MVTLQQMNNLAEETGIVMRTSYGQDPKVDLTPLGPIQLLELGGSGGPALKAATNALC